MNDANVASGLIPKRAARTAPFAEIAGSKTVSGSKVLRDVQALRAVAAVLVVLKHISTYAVGVEAKYFPTAPAFLKIFTMFGNFGVDIFFVISGFIMFTTTARQFSVPGASLQFFLRRCVRIYPPYWLVLVILAAIDLVAARHFTHFFPAHVSALDWVSSFLLLPQANDLHDVHPLLQVSWTLVFEMSFYVVFALLLMMKRAYVLPAMAVWFVAEIALYFVFGKSQNVYLAFLGTPLAIEFIAGVAIGYLYSKRLFPAPRSTFYVAIAVCIGSWILTDRIVGAEFPVVERLVLFGIPAALLTYGVIGLEVAEDAKSPNWAVTLGDSSYALYLWHFPLVYFIAHFALQRRQSLFLHYAFLAGMFAFIVLFSVAVYSYVERPMTQALNRRFFLKKAAPPGGLTPSSLDLAP